VDEAATIGADQVVATDDDAISNLPIDKVKPGRLYPTIVGLPQNAAK
jgi:hypothetical protein